MKPSLASQWTMFRAMVVPSTAGDTQVRETKRAFYAGAQAVLMLQMQIAMADQADDKSAQDMQALHQECATFAQQIQAGQA